MWLRRSPIPSRRHHHHHRSLRVRAPALRRHIDRSRGATRIPVWRSSCFPRTVRPMAGMPGETPVRRLLEAVSRSAAASSRGIPSRAARSSRTVSGPPRQPRCRRLRAVRPEVLRRPPFGGLCLCACRVRVGYAAFRVRVGTLPDEVQRLCQAPRGPGPGGLSDSSVSSAHAGYGLGVSLASAHADTWLLLQRGDFTKYLNIREKCLVADERQVVAGCRNRRPSWRLGGIGGCGNRPDRELTIPGAMLA